MKVKNEVEEMDTPQTISLAIFIISFILIFSGRIERCVAALFGLFMMASAGYFFGFLTFEDLLFHVNWEVILLLFGMMTYVGLMTKTGFFKYLATKSIKMSKGEPWLIFLYLSLITTFVSMVIDNVTTILLMIPLTIEVAGMLEINPIPVILGEALLSDIGGVATLIGDPPNIMIGVASNLTFNDFVLNLILPVITALLVSIIIARIIYRKWVKKETKNFDEVVNMNASDYIENKKQMKYLLLLLLGMLFFFGTETYTGISPAFVALSGGIIALLISMEDPEEAFKAVEWPTLIFFIALFSLVGGLEETGLLNELAGGIVSLSSNVIVISIIILWVTGISSAFVDNIPVTAAFIPVVSIMSVEYNSNLIWWALAMGVGMGGNLTPIGSSANVVTVSLSKRYGHEITIKEWFKLGSTTGIASLLVATVFLMFM